MLMLFTLFQGIWLAWYIGDEGVWVCFSICCWQKDCSNTHDETEYIDFMSSCMKAKKMLTSEGLPFSQQGAPSLIRNNVILSAYVAESSGFQFLGVLQHSIIAYKSNILLPHVLRREYTRSMHVV